MRKVTLLTLLSAFLRIVHPQPTIALQTYATGFTSPVDIANCGDERLFIVEQNGYIRIIDGQGNVKPQPFLDIDSRVSSGGERGLLGLAFHPDYRNNGYFFVNYTDNNGDTKVSRFQVTSNPDVADASSETLVLFVDQPYSNHNGGNLEFGPDGYLYIGMGDGGGGGDPDDNGQDPLALLGKILRLDVDTLPYRIPSDNPFYGFASVRNEIWALGLRNPWRFSFDRLTGDLWMGDVGQNQWEEINFQPASSTGGENYGWRCYEGNHFYSSSGFGCTATFTYPVFEYNHGSGCSVNGGYVYRGCKYPNLFGYYVCNDYCSGRFWLIKDMGGGNFQATQALTQGTNYSSFGEDMNGEIYVAQLNGTIYHLTEATPATLPSITASPGTSFCPGGSVTLSTQPGFSSYNWLRDGITTVGSGLQITVNASGRYTLTVTGNNGCIYTTPGTTVSAITAPVPVISAPVTTFCDGDSVQLTTGNFSAYAWSDGSSTWTTFAKQTGSYTVTVTDAFGCTGSSSPFSVTEISNPQPVITAPSSSFCAGKSLQLSTGNFAAYNWSHGSTSSTMNVNQAGNYTVTVTDANGCTGASPAFTVTENPVPQPVITASASSFCKGDSVLLSAGSFAAYNWSNGSSSSSAYAKQGGDYYLTVTDNNGCDGVSAPFTLVENPQPQPVISAAASMFCEGDSAQLSTGNFASYLWWDGSTSSSIIVTESGIYSVTVTDGNGCTGAASPFAVTVNPLPQPVIQQAGYLCAGTTAILSAGAYVSYQWSTLETTSQITVNQAGTFSVTVTDTNGCTGASPPFTVVDNQIPPPVVSASNGTSFCEGGSTDLDAGSGYLYYAWSTGSSQQSITVSQGGNYIVSVTDANGCVGVASLVITVFLLPTPEILPGSVVVQCGDGAVELNTESAYSDYYWSTGDTASTLLVSSNGTFNVTVTDANGCTGISDSARVIFVPNPPVTDIIQPSISSSVIYAEDSGYHYQWYADDVPLPGDTFQSFDWSTAIASMYNVELTDDNGCSTLSNPYYPVIDGIKQTMLSNIRIHPNPFTSEIILSYSQSKAAGLHIRLLDLLGKEVAVIVNEKQNAGSHVVTLNTGRLGLTEGIYFLELEAGVVRRTYKVVKM